jgi:hypothetical protein
MSKGELLTRTTIWIALTGYTVPDTGVCQNSQEN